MSGWLVQTTWKGCEMKQSLLNLRYCTVIFLNGLRKTTKDLRTLCVPDVIRAGNLQNTSQKHYHLNQAPRFKWPLPLGFQTNAM
jgi:hypothetical protein